MENPFIITGKIKPEYFCDRDVEAEKIIRKVTSGENIVLMAARRVGKSKLIDFCLDSPMVKNDFIAISIDILRTSSIQEFAFELGKAVFEQAAHRSQKMLKMVVSTLKSINGCFGYDPISNTPTFNLSLGDISNPLYTLDEIFACLEHADKKCIVAIDEFQQIVEYPEKGVEALLRSYIQFLPNVNFIFAGSKQHQIQEMFTSSRRPFYQSTQPLTIGPIQRDEYASFATGHFAEHNVKLHQEVFNSIYEKYEGHTWYVQCLLNRLYGYDRNVDMELVSYATEQILSEYSYMYADLLKTYSFGQVRLLKAIAREGCVKEVLAGDFISAHKLRAASSVSASLKKLLDNELIYQTPCGYIIYDRFMSEWLRKQPF